MTIKLAHISDIHFYHLNKSPLQFFSKRFLANFNALLTRKSKFDSNLAYEVLPFLKNEGVTHLLISGDFTSSSSGAEFQMMQNYIKAAKNYGFNIFAIPGNHDAYTRSAHRNRAFFSYLGNLLDFGGDTHHNLIDHHVSAHKLLDSWWVVLLNCSKATALHKSTGVFSPEIETSLIDLLNVLPKECTITVACHYPFELYKFPKAHLERGKYLEKILKNDPRIRIYLHGHRHLHRIEKQGNMIIADSGSISLKNHSSFNILDFKPINCEITHYQRLNNTWSRTDVRETITALV